MQRGVPRCEMRNPTHSVASVKAPGKIFSRNQPLGQPSSFRPNNSRLFDSFTLPNRSNDGKGPADTNSPQPHSPPPTTSSEITPQTPFIARLWTVSQDAFPGVLPVLEVFRNAPLTYGNRGNLNHETSYRRCRSCGINRGCGDGRLAFHRCFFFGPFSRQIVQHPLARCLHLPPGKPVRSAVHPVRLAAVLLAAPARRRKTLHAHEPASRRPDGNHRHRPCRDRTGWLRLDRNRRLARPGLV